MTTKHNNKTLVVASTAILAAAMLVFAAVLPNNIPVFATPGVTPPIEEPDCNTAYVNACIPNAEGDAYNCKDLLVNQIQLADVANDPYNLDGDNDGVGCEGASGLAQAAETPAAEGTATEEPRVVKDDGSSNSGEARAVVEDDSGEGVGAVDEEPVVVTAEENETTLVLPVEDNTTVVTPEDNASVIIPFPDANITVVVTEDNTTIVVPEDNATVVVEEEPVVVVPEDNASVPVAEEEPAVPAPVEENVTVPAVEEETPVVTPPEDNASVPVVEEPIVPEVPVFKDNTSAPVEEPEVVTPPVVAEDNSSAPPVVEEEPAVPITEDEDPAINTNSTVVDQAVIEEFQSNISIHISTLIRAVISGNFEQFQDEVQVIRDIVTNFTSEVNTSISENTTETPVATPEAENGTIVCITAPCGPFEEPTTPAPVTEEPAVPQEPPVKESGGVK